MYLVNKLAVPYPSLNIVFAVRTPLGFDVGARRTISLFSGVRHTGYREFIVKRELDGRPIWLMPAGLADKHYAAKLNTIDWHRLYTECEGYLMFEDLKNQWSQKLGFDYVLIDSRTGYTDVGGICTRQLPDAVVLLFFPNDQNINGMLQVVSDIRAEESGPRQKSIHLHFCPSNVPDLDDEDLILQRHLEEGMKRLGYVEPSSVIHHYNSLSLLDQEIFVEDRQRSKLAQEYRTLTDAIVAENLEDREGALSKLRQMKVGFRERNRILPDSEEVLARIYKLHPKDGEVAFSSAEMYQFLGDFESEREMLTNAIDAKIRQENPARSRRALLNVLRGAPDLAKADLRTVVLSPQVTGFELSRAIGRLRDIDPDWLSTIRKSPALSRLKRQELHRIVDALMFDRDGCELAVSLLVKVGDEAKQPLALAMIGSGQVEAAQRVIARDRDEVLNSDKIEDVFNYACAEWVGRGTAPIDLFDKVADLSGHTADERSGPNFFQCLALSEYVRGNHTKATKWLDSARRTKMSFGPVPLFSSWRYLNVNRDDFRSDLNEMARQFKSDGPLLPVFVRDLKSLIKEPV